MPLSPSTPVGAFTNVTVAAINAALAQAGFSTTGNVFYCDPVNGLDTNDGQTSNAVPLSGGHGPVQTLGAGYALLRNGFNDILVLIGNGQSSGSARLAAGFTWAKNAAHLIGICAPSAVSQRARIAPFTGAAQAAFANFFTVSGNGCLFSNVSWFHGFNAGIAAAICMTITGSRNAFVNCDFEGMGDATSAADAGSRSILISAGGQENYFGHCNVGLDTVQRTNANSSVEIAGGGPRNEFEDCTFPVDSSDGLQYMLLAANAAALRSLDTIQELHVYERPRLWLDDSGCLISHGCGFRWDCAARHQLQLDRDRHRRHGDQSSGLYGRSGWSRDRWQDDRCFVNGFQRTHCPQNNQRWCGLRLRLTHRTEPADFFMLIYKEGRVVGVRQPYPDRAATRTEHPTISHRLARAAYWLANYGGLRWRAWMFECYRWAENRHEMQFLPPPLTLEQKLANSAAYAEYDQALKKEDAQAS